VGGGLTFALAGFDTFVEAKFPTLLGDIRSKKKLDDTLRGQLKSAVEQFKAQFKA
jgi:hypothetical protein